MTRYRNATILLACLILSLGAMAAEPQYRERLSDRELLLEFDYRFAYLRRNGLRSEELTSLHNETGLALVSKSGQQRYEVLLSLHSQAGGLRASRVLLEKGDVRILGKNDDNFSANHDWWKRAYVYVIQLQYNCNGN